MSNMKRFEVRKKRRETASQVMQRILDNNSDSDDHESPLYSTLSAFQPATTEAIPMQTSIIPSPSPTSTTASPTHSSSSPLHVATPIPKRIFKLKCSSKTKLSTRNVRWVWTDNHVESLLGILKDFKTFCDFKGIDFESDGPQLNESVRIEMAKIYPIEDFGPEIINNEDSFQKSLASKGKIRVRDKILKIRSIYRNSVKENRRSGGGKVVTENWDTLVFLWEGSPSVTSLPFGKRSADKVDENVDFDAIHVGEEDVAIDEEADGEDALEEAPISAAKRLKFSILDNKRRNLQKNLSANQRDQLYLNIAKDDLKLKEKMIENMVESSNKIASSIDKMSVAMGEIGKGLGMMAFAIGNMNNQPPRFPSTSHYQSSMQNNEIRAQYQSRTNHNQFYSTPAYSYSPGHFNQPH